MNSKPKLLIVDDKPENLVALRTVLRDLDIDLVEATSGNDALKAILRNDFALALLDIQMPEMDGYELAGILREEERTMHLPFIFISAVYTDNRNVFKGYEKGAFSFITKPFQPEILINKVKFFIEKHQQEIALIELNEELKNANKEMEAFSYSVSHDLRAPLRALNGYSTMLEEDYSSNLDDSGKRLVANIKQNAVKMSSLIDSLLSFSRLGKKEIVKSEINMNDLVREVVSEMEKSGLNKAEFKIGAMPVARADYRLISQVMVNLVSNALKYSSGREKPVVELFATEGKDEIIFTVKDNGVGFDMKYYDKLFGVFQRLHSAEDFEGTGVGLAIVERIISRHKGRIWAEGKVNEGAVFNFSLPVGA